MKEISLLELLKNGVHFGHLKSHRHPKMEPYIFGLRNGVHIINLEKTLEKLNEALEFIKKITQTKGIILFIATKRQAQEIVKRYAISCGMPYITQRWLGGLFTNFSNVSQLQKKLKQLEEEKISGELSKYTKKEQLKFQEEINKLNGYVGGIKDMNILPQAIFVVDIKKEKTAVKEARKKKIPIVAFVDTNDNPQLVDYAIPANNDATKSIELITGLIAEAVKEGKDQAQPEEKKKSKTNNEKK